jgi:hypothetical protein
MNYLDIPIFVWDHSGVGEIVLLKWECEAQKVSQGWSRLVKAGQTQSNHFQVREPRIFPIDEHGNHANMET